MVGQGKGETPEDAEALWKGERGVRGDGTGYILGKDGGRWIRRERVCEGDDIVAYYWLVSLAQRIIVETACSRSARNAILRWRSASFVVGVQGTFRS